MRSSSCVGLCCVVIYCGVGDEICLQLVGRSINYLRERQFEWRQKTVPSDSNEKCCILCKKIFVVLSHYSLAGNKN